MDNQYDPMEIFAFNLKRLREKRHMTQAELAKQLDVSITFINYIENSQRWISADNIAKIAEILEVDIYEFFLTKDVINTGLYGTNSVHEDILLDVKDIVEKYGVPYEPDSEKSKY